MNRAQYADYLIKFNARDYEGVLAYYAPDFDIVFAGYRLRGRGEMLRFYGFFHQYVRESIVIDGFASSDELVAVQARVRLQGLKDLPAEVLRAEGFERLVGLPAGAVVEIPQFIHYRLNAQGQFTKAECAVFEGVR